MEKNVLDDSKRNIYVILNPVAGNSDPDELRQALEELSKKRGWIHKVYVTTGEENIAEVTRAACSEGANLVIAAGGDGTVASVVNGLKDTGVPLGIIPVGTGNGLARAMRIPLEPEQAMQLLFGEHTVMAIDAMQVSDRIFVLNVSAGISSRAMRDTEPEEKQRFGMLAYARKIIQDAVETEPSVFNITLDGLQIQVKASEVLVSNAKLLKEPPYLFGAREGFNDGEFEVNILTASDTNELVRLAWNLLVDPEESKKDLHDLTVRESIIIDVAGEPLPVQGDGEEYGQTPVEVSMLRNAIQIIVPTEEQLEDTGVSLL